MRFFMLVLVFVLTNTAALAQTQQSAEASQTGIQPTNTVTDSQPSVPDIGNVQANNAASPVVRARLENEVGNNPIPQLPKQMVLWSYPYIIAPKLGPSFTISNIVVEGQTVRGLVTFDRAWGNGCVIVDDQIEGKFDGKNLHLAVVVPPDDQKNNKKTCPVFLTLERKSNGKFVGQFSYAKVDDVKGRIEER
jgi:hypothetical protein